MHTALFALKRAFHCSVRFTTRVLEPFGLTPARFDLMFALYKAWSWHTRRGTRGVGQTELVSMFGVSRPTISRMLRSLEELGLVRRHRSTWDGRCKYVGLTLRGLRCILRALWSTMTGMVQLAVESILSPRGWHSAADTYRDVHRLRDPLNGVRLSLGDTSRFDYFLGHSPVFYEHPPGPEVNRP